MSERPILFSGPMVRAILDGRKTQTRRVVKPQPSVENNIDAAWRDAKADLWRNARQFARDCCPYGQPGDLLWVRETWAHYQCIDSVRRTDGRSFSEVSDGLAGYKADGFESIEDFRKHVQMMSGIACEAVEVNGNRWRPSIHMPRWASRLTLRITNVRVERLQEISEADAFAEGMRVPVYPKLNRIACFEYAELWESINGKGSWDANPWVWIIEFERIKQKAAA